ncbi:MAG: choice-of-anchor J domain-containing protein [Bacteroides sp.]|jgi:hypothetical protein|nr:choice-of-anchor J domain-containing protein [Bacteroides sp.]
MKKRLLFFVSFAWPVIALVANERPLGERPGLPKALTNVSVTTSTDYVAGQNNLIAFTLSFSSPDFEYADGFEISFPNGVVPTQAGTSTVIGDIESEISLNIPVSGQTISWGTIPGGSQFGDLFPGSYQFSVNVNVEPDFAGSIIASYTLHGDTYGSQPHIVSGDVIILAQNAPRLPSNPIPANYQTNVSLDGTLSWDFGNNTQTYDLWFGPEGNMIKVVSGASAGVSGSYTYSGLNQNTIYQWQVMAFNASKAFTNGPVWSFITASGPVSQFPYLQNFDGTWIGDPAAPESWTVINGDGDDFTWTQANTYIEPTPSEPYAAHGMGNQNDWIISPALDLSSDYVTLKWFDKVESETRINSYKVLVSTTTPDIGSFTHELADIICNNTEWTQHALSLGDFFGQTIYVAFFQYFSGAENWGFGIDDFELEPFQTCPLPVDLSASATTYESALLGWSSQGAAVSWNLEWGPGSFSQGNGTLITGIPTNAYLLEGLDGETLYSFYVQAVCGEGFSSPWAGPFSFTTEPEPPEVVCPGDLTICEAADAFLLTGATPLGGSYEGQGVVEGMFNPTTAGAGEHIITYTYQGISCEFTVTVTPAVTVSVSISANQTDVCEGSPVTFTASPVNGGTSPVFQWKLNGQDAGNNSPQFAFVPSNNDQVWVILTSSESCAFGSPATSNILTIGVHPYPSVSWEWGVETIAITDAPVALSGGLPSGGIYSGPGVSSGFFNPAVAGLGTHTLTYTYTSPYGCAGSAATEVEVTGEPPVCVIPTGLSAEDITQVSATLLWTPGGDETEWNLQWAEGSFSPGGGTLVSGLTNNTFPLSGLNAATQYSYYVQAVCGEANVSAWAGPYGFSTEPEPPEVICPGDMEVCEAAALFALTGATPPGGVYAGPGVSAGSFDPATAGPGSHLITYTYQEVSCEFYITVIEALQVSVAISSDQTEVCDGTSVTFTSVPVNAGDSPAFQWKVNGENSGSNNPEFSYVPQDGDEVLVILTSSESCTLGNPATSNTIAMTVNEIPLVTWDWEYETVCLQVPSLPLTGGDPPGGVYSGPGVEGDLFLPQTAGVGTHTLTYSYTTPEGCSASATKEILVDACTGLTEHQVQEGILVYPNPVSSTLTLKVIDSKLALTRFLMIDLSGKEVVSIELSPSETLRVIDVSHLPQGIYFFQLIEKQSVYSGRIVVID